MSFEGYIAKKEYEPSFDEELFKRFQESKVAVLPSLQPDSENLAQEKKMFLDGETQCPHFTYEKLQSKNFEDKELHLVRLKKELEENVTLPKALAQTYIWAINERIAKIRMLMEVQKVAVDNDKNLHMKRFARYAEFIYGKADPEIFAGLSVTLTQKLEEVANKVPPEKSDAYNRLCALRERINLSGSIPKVWNQDDDIIEHGEVVTSVEAVKISFEEALSEIGLGEEWKVVIDEKNTRQTIAVSPEKKQILLPDEAHLSMRTRSQQMTPEMIRGLIMHEIATHALRNHNGIRSRIKLLSIGLDRYEEGEEGLATYRQQKETGARDYAGFDNYLAGGLAKGLDGEAERDFAQVHQILQDYYCVCDAQEESVAKEQAWNKCMRIFRGTTGNIPGVIFAKDMLYRKGNIATYSLMQKEGSEKIDFNVGKFDPSNQRHIGVLVELGVLDQDLLDLSKDDSHIV